ncbi:MAG: hypothetical protein KDA44_10410 [Planctomycetales bacterium]|nr:hypothetical protein [Planctomycetales bacterium]
MGLERWRPGETKQGVPVEAWNRFCGAVERVDALKVRPDVQPTAPLAHLPVMAVCAFDTSFAAVVGLASALQDPGANAVAPYQGPPALAAVVPVSPDHDGAYGIVTKAGAAGTTIEIAVVGHVWARVDVIIEAHTRCSLQDGDKGTLRSDWGGTARIVWKEAGTGKVWAVIQLQAPPDVATIVKGTAVADWTGTGDEMYVTNVLQGTDPRDDPTDDEEAVPVVNDIQFLPDAGGIVYVIRQFGEEDLYVFQAECPAE